MKSQNITFPVICLNPDFLPEVSDILMRKQEAFVGTKHLRLENAERGRESESNRGAARSQSRKGACLSLTDLSEIQTSMAHSGPPLEALLKAKNAKNPNIQPGGLISYGAHTQQHVARAIKMTKDL